MTRNLRLLAVFAALLLPAPSFAADAPGGSPEVEIPFANHGGIYDWQPDGDKGIFLLGRSRKDWYYAKFFAPCIDLPWTNTVGFISEPTGSFDKFSSVSVRGQKCQVTSLTRSDPPPGWKPKKKPAAQDKPAK